MEAPHDTMRAARRSRVRGILLVYGATGFTGSLLVDALMEHGLRPVIAGRDRRKLAAKAERLGLPYRIAELRDAKGMDAALEGVDVAVHVAGPFVKTARPMAEACLRAGVHYLDLGGEALGIESLFRYDADARRRGIMILPAIGFDVVPSDCLVAHVARRLPSATELAIGIGATGFLSPGSAKSFIEYAGEPVRVRRGGALVCVPPGTLEHVFDFGERGRLASCALSWGDTASAWYTTGIPNITTYFEATARLRAALAFCRWFGPAMGSPSLQAVMKAYADMVSAGPTAEQRASRRMMISVEAWDAAGRRAAARIQTPDSYGFTAVTASAISLRVLKGDLEPGFQTPGRVYGPDFVLGFEGVIREDAEA
jgi:short subunit dehydrogenase-like uncharacterized protein